MRDFDTPTPNQKIVPFRANSGSKNRFVSNSIPESIYGSGSGPLLSSGNNKPNQKVGGHSGTRSQMVSNPTSICPSEKGGINQSSSTRKDSEGKRDKG